MRMRLGKIAREILVTPSIDLISNDDGGLHRLIISLGQLRLNGSFLALSPDSPLQISKVRGLRAQSGGWVESTTQLKMLRGGT
jgi:hypothetical protein